MLEASFPLVDSEGAQNALARGVEADYEINRRRVKGEPHVRSRRRGVLRTRVRVVDGDQSFAAPAHPPLCVEEFFGRNVVSVCRRVRDVSQAIERRGLTSLTA